MSGPIVLLVGPSTEQLLEGLPELWAEDGVDDRVQRGVEVSQPQEEAEHPVVDTVVAQRRHQRRHEEGQPAQDKGAGDDGQSLGRLLLPLCLQADVLLLLLPLHLLLRRGGEQLKVLRLAGGVAPLRPAVLVAIAPAAGGGGQLVAAGRRGVRPVLPAGGDH